MAESATEVPKKAAGGLLKFAWKTAVFAGVSFAATTAFAATAGGGLAAAATLSADSGIWDIGKAVYNEAGSEVLGMFGGEPS